MKNDDIREYVEYMDRADGILFIAEKIYYELLNKQEALKKYSCAMELYGFAEMHANQVGNSLLEHRAHERKTYCEKQVEKISALIKLEEKDITK